MKASTEETIDQVLERFSNVMADRRTVFQLFELFERLRVSDRFPHKAKPMCCLNLVTECLERVNNSQLEPMLKAMESANAISFLQRSIPEQTLEPVLGELVLRFFNKANISSHGMMAAFKRMELSGISVDRAHTLQLLFAGGAEEAAVSNYCEITAKSYYGPNYGFLSRPKVPAEATT